MKRLIIAAVFCAPLAGCGGGSAPNNPTAVAAPVIVPSCTPHLVKIQLFGDSTLWGYDGVAGNGSRAAVFPELALQATMDAKYGRGAVSIETRAVSGTITTNLIEGSDGVNKPWPQSVNADIIVVTFGINDKYTNMAPETYKANLLKLSVSPAKIIFMAPLPVYYTSNPSLSYAAEMKAVAASIGAPVADASAMALSTPDWLGYYAPDGVHPNSAGYQLLVDKVLAPAVDKLVAPLRCK